MRKGRLKTMRDIVHPELSRFDTAIRSQGAALLAGVDEAGRGPLAGSVFAAAVILPEGLDIPYLNDSKKITEKRREQLFDVICASAYAYGIGEATVEEIEQINILNAAMLAMRRAIAALKDSTGRPVRPDLALIDGNTARGFDLPVQCVVGGDAKSASIAAASVLAKVSRDRSMRLLAEQYPMYGFEQHKGYGTPKHYAAIDQFGLLPVHRLSFLTKNRQGTKKEE